MCRFRDLTDSGHETPGTGFFLELPGGLFEPGSRFCEVFELWVHPDYRRQGLATRLKGELEVASLRRGLSLIYTHTETTNAHVVELNLKMGYHVIRRGPIWDEVERVPPPTQGTTSRQSKWRKHNRQPDNNRYVGKWSTKSRAHRKG